VDCRLSRQFQLADEALFERVQNDDWHVLRLLMPPKTEHSYNLRRRRHDYELIKKTSTLNTNHFLIRMLYKDSYWHYLVPVFSNSKQSLPPLMRTCHYWINEYCIVFYCIAVNSCEVMGATVVDLHWRSAVNSSSHCSSQPYVLLPASSDQFDLSVSIRQRPQTTGLSFCQTTATADTGAPTAKLHWFQNVTVSLVTSAHRSDHIMPVLQRLKESIPLSDWLPEFWLKCLTGWAYSSGLPSSLQTSMWQLPGLDVSFAVNFAATSLSLWKWRQKNEQYGS